MLNFKTGFCYPQNAENYVTGWSQRTHNSVISQPEAQCELTSVPCAGIGILDDFISRATWILPVLTLSHPIAWRTLGLSLWPLLHLTLDRKCYLLANIVLSVSWQLGPSPDAIHVSPPSCNHMLPSTTEGHHNLNWVLLFPNQHFPVPSHPACVWHMTAFLCSEADMYVRVCSCAHLHNTHILHLGGSWRPSLSSIIACTNEWNHGLLMCPFLRSQQSTPVAKLRTVALSWWVNIPGNASELYCIPEARATPNYSTLNCVQS